jgi:hypothetical protein
MEGKRSMRGAWFLAGWVAIMALRLAGAHGLPNAVVLRFSDMASEPYQPWPRTTVSTAADAATVSAASWLRQQAWEKVWPKLFLGKGIELDFAGPPGQRYLRLSADNAYAIWSRRLTVDPQHQPVLEITWGVERFPEAAALDLQDRNDRAIVIVVSLGPEMPSGGLRPNVPRGLAFFWGETETVGATYTCIPPRQGSPEARLQCVYPHVKFIALRRGDAGTVHTDRVHLLELFRQQFPDYWQKHQHVPPVVAVSFEARADRTKSHTIARLYALAFRAAGE